MTRVRIYPKVNVVQNGYYLHGLHQALGGGGVAFSDEGFPPLSRQILAMVVESRPERKVVIDAMDPPRCYEDALAWCDVYAKVNYEPSEIPERWRHKVVPVAPGITVRIWPLGWTVWHMLRNFRRDVSQPRKHFRNYWYQYRHRRAETAYRPAAADENFVYGYFTARRDNPPETERFRANFILACQDLPGVRFDGGFDPVAPAEAFEFEHLTVPRRHSTREFFEKTRRSVVSFLCPAHEHCHSWRVAECFALGKAIVATPFKRALPAPPEHGRHLHYVDGSVASIREAVAYIRANPGYRRTLETNARLYYDEYLQPARVVERLLRHASAPSPTPVPAAAVPAPL